MKNNRLRTNYLKEIINNSNSSISEEIKTTNVNVLLNRVRIDRKKEFIKKIIYFSLILSIFLITGIIILI
tara:strand:- start:3315 stop:3524 length:210 start_codon:yes stop_codon:yes gene_type:complete